jgi:DNA gyrase subunit A
VTENGYGKRTQVGEYRLQHRGGSGIINIKTSERNGNVVSMMTVDDNDELVLVATDGIVIRTSVKDIRTIGRNTQGVTVMKPQEGAKVSAVAKAVPEESDDDDSGADGDSDADDSSPDDVIEEGGEE